MNKHDPVKLQRTEEKLPNIGLYLSQKLPTLPETNTAHAKWRMGNWHQCQESISLIEFQSFNQWINVNKCGELDSFFIELLFFGYSPEIWHGTWTRMFYQQKSAGGRTRRTRRTMLNLRGIRDTVTSNHCFNPCILHCFNMLSQVPQFTLEGTPFHPQGWFLIFLSLGQIRNKYMDFLQVTINFLQIFSTFLFMRTPKFMRYEWHWNVADAPQMLAHALSVEPQMLVRVRLLHILGILTSYK